MAAKYRVRRVVVAHVRVWAVQRQSYGAWHAVVYFDNWQEAFNRAELLANAGRASTP